MPFGRSPWVGERRVLLTKRANRRSNAARRERGDDDDDVPTAPNFTPRRYYEVMERGCEIHCGPEVNLVEMELSTPLLSIPLTSPTYFDLPIATFSVQGKKLLELQRL